MADIGESEELLVVGGAVIIGGISLGISYLFDSLARNQAQKAAYLHATPKFKSFGTDLYRHLNSQPSQQADVLVEGTVQKLDEFHMYSEKAGVSGAGRAVYTVQHYKVRNEASGGKWNHTSTTTENVCLSVPFNLKGQDGKVVRVESAHSANGFRGILSEAYKEDSTHEGKTLGDFAIDMTVNKIPMGKQVTELMLYFGAPFAGYGQAKLQSKFMNSDILFSPQEVSTSINSLISNNESMANVYRFLSWISFAVVGGVVVFIIVPKVINIVQEKSRGRRQ